MMVKIIVSIALLCVTVHVSECNRNHDSNKLVGSPHKLKVKHENKTTHHHSPSSHTAPYKSEVKSKNKTITTSRPSPPPPSKTRLPPVNRTAPHKSKVKSKNKTITTCRPSPPRPSKTPLPPVNRTDDKLLKNTTTIRPPSTIPRPGLPPVYPVQKPRNVTTTSYPSKISTHGLPPVNLAVQKPRNVTTTPYTSKIPPHGLPPVHPAVQKPRNVTTTPYPSKIPPHGLPPVHPAAGNFMRNTTTTRHPSMIPPTSLPRFNPAYKGKQNDSTELIDLLLEIKDKLITNTTTTTTHRPSTIPPPRWKPLSAVHSAPYVGYNPAGYGPLPPIYYCTNGGASIPQPHYTVSDTGSTALGLFLKSSLAKIKTPTYYYYNTNYDAYGYIPKYDHYTIHHYHHNRKSIEAEATIHPDAIVVCIGGNSVLCPANTTSLCTNNGALLCVASISSTISCASKNTSAQCIRSRLPCQYNKNGVCQPHHMNKTSILIPCISTANTYETVSVAQESFVVSNNFTSYSLPLKLCVTVLALPAERSRSKGEQFLNGAGKFFSAFAVRALGITEY